jgi:hypothetical protein
LSAGVSLWHKIFGAPAEQAAKMTSDESADGASMKIEETDLERGPWSGDDASANPVIEAEAIDEERQVEAGSESDETDPESRRRRSRRRRRGRGGRSAETRGDREQVARRRQRPTASDGPRAHDDDFDDLGVEQDLDDEFGAGPARDKDLEDENLSDDLSDSESNGQTSEGRGNRRIPSWDEAIGMIVESNLQSRSQRRSTSHSTSGPRGGRGRGGRRRRKPSGG